MRRVRYRTCGFSGSGSGSGGVEIFLTGYFCGVRGKRAGLERSGEVSPDNKAP